MVLNITSLQASPQACGSIGAGADGAAAGSVAAGEVVIAGAVGVEGGAGATGATPSASGFERGNGPPTVAIAGLGLGSTFDDAVVIAVAAELSTTIGGFGE